jgi:hypothetical protein
MLRSASRALPLDLLLDLALEGLQAPLQVRELRLLPLEFRGELRLARREPILPLPELVEGVLELSLLGLELGPLLLVGFAFDLLGESLAPLAESLHVRPEARQLVAGVLERATEARDALVLGSQPLEDDLTGVRVEGDSLERLAQQAHLVEQRFHRRAVSIPIDQLVAVRTREAGRHSPLAPEVPRG